MTTQRAGGNQLLIVDMARASVASFDISGWNIIQVLNPPAVVGVEIALEPGEYIPLTPGMPIKFRACQREYTRISIRHAAIGGSLYLLACNSANEPFISGGGGASPLTNRVQGTNWSPDVAGADGGALQQQWHAIGGNLNGASSFDYWNTLAAGAANVPVNANRVNRSVALTQVTGIGGASGMRVGMQQFPWKRTRQQFGQNLGDIQPVSSYLIEWFFGRDTATPAGIGHGFFLQDSDGTAYGNPSANNPFFGIVFNVVTGKWMIATRNVGGAALTFSLDIELPGALTDENKGAIELVNASPREGRDGLVVFYLNDRAVLTIDDMTQIPALGVTKAAATQYLFAMQDENSGAVIPPGHSLWVHSVSTSTWRNGRAILGVT